MVGEGRRPAAAAARPGVPELVPWHHALPAALSCHWQASADCQPAHSPLFTLDLWDPRFMTFFLSVLSVRSKCCRLAVDKQASALVSPACFRG